MTSILPARWIFTFYVKCISYLHRLQVGADFQVTREGEEEQNSEEDETEVLKYPHAEEKNMRYCIVL